MGWIYKLRIKYGRTALHYAVYLEKSKVAQRLVEAGLDPTQPEYSGNFPIQTALKLGMHRFALQNLPEVDTLCSKAYGRILNTAAFSGYEDVFTKILQRVPETRLVKNTRYRVSIRIDTVS